MRARGRGPQGHDRLRALFDFLVSEGADASPLLRPDADVPSLLTLATRHKVSWALARRLLEERGPGLDEPALAAVRACDREWTAWRRTVRHQVGEVWGAGATPLMHVKGLAAEHWNGDRFVRDSGDLDVVAPDLRAAAAVLDRLLDLDYRLEETCWLHLTPAGGLQGPIVMVSDRPDEDQRAVELNVGGFPPGSFVPSLPLALDEGADLPVGDVTMRIANRMQSLLVLCAETMHRDLFVRDAIDLVLIVERGGPDAVVPALLAEARAAGLGWALGRLARFALSLLPDRPDEMGRRVWLRRLVGPPGALGVWPSVGGSLAAAWGPRRGAELLARYAHYRVESWLFDRDRALAWIQRVNRRRDPVAVLTRSGAPVFTIPVHSGRTERLRGVAGLRPAAEDPAGDWWIARHGGAPLLVLPAGVYLLSVDCVLEPSDIARLGRELGGLAAAS
ncbi:MAG TPA: nucleotidyltransferase family protein [Candidatus Dormibacteraeota bacterium]|nr:nucleotidyltransferase family protein [Candidatus Dormibacteraeota bacterium]